MLETKDLAMQEITGTIPAKSNAAQSSTSDLAPGDFERKAVGAHDVLIKIKFCGVCHMDIHFTRNDWVMSV